MTFSQKKRFFQIAILAFYCFLSLWILLHLEPPPLPDPKEPLLFYTEDMQAVVLRYIAQATHSLLIIVYNLSDLQVIESIKAKSDQGVLVEIIVDINGFYRKNSLLGEKTILTKQKTKGIMHQKIIVVDDSLTLLGSSNLTTDSLKLHDNSLVGIYHQGFAKAIRQHWAGQATPNPYVFTLPQRTLEFWSTPSHNAKNRLIEVIQNTKHTLDLALFTFTSQPLAEQLLEASKRGVQVNVCLDRQQSKGAGRKITELLQAHLPLKQSQGVGLFHHKLLLADDHTCVIGSLNWTQAAFTQNNDCFIIIQGLQPKEVTKIRGVFKNTYEASNHRVRQDGQTGRKTRISYGAPSDLHHFPLAA